MTSRSIPLLAAAALLGASVASAGTAGSRPAGVGVLVETTGGAHAAEIRAARADVARLRARGVDAQLRVTRSPSESLAAGATLVTRGAGTLITRDVAEAAAIVPLQHRLPELRVVRR